MSAWAKKHPLATYLILAFALSWACELPLVAITQGWLRLPIPFALHYLAGRLPAAQAAMAQALLLGEPGGYVRVFLGQADAIRPLLAALAPHSTPAAALLHQLNAAPGPGGPGAPFAEPLTERELEVLQLISQGLSNAEIAARLVITLNTTKVHVKHLFAKLGATTRTQALARARHAGLVD